MKILFMHPNMPGQYKHLCAEFAKDPKNVVVFVTKNKTALVPGVHKVIYEVPRDASPHAHRYMIHAERAVLQGQEAWRCLKRLRDEEGFYPDVICAHPGWGDALYVKDVYPNASLLSFFEFFYHSHGADVNFEASDQAKPDDEARVRTKNMHHLLGLVDSDWGLCPTHWQHSLHPKEFQSKISVIHDGIDTEVCKPNPTKTVTLSKDLTFKYGDEVVTYIARNFEPYRGFGTFMKAAEIILRERPNCHIIAIGADEVSYGRKPPAGTTYRQILSQEVNVDKSRLHFVGTLPYDQMISVLQISAAHIYLTYPFVLSWSSMESMACGCAVIGSDTPPVREVITHGENGFLVDFFSPEAVANQVFEVLDHPTRMQHIRDAARELIVNKYDIKKLLPLHMQLVRDVADKKFPPPVDKEIQLMQPKSTPESLYVETQKARKV